MIEIQDLILNTIGIRSCCFTYQLKISSTKVLFNLRVKRLTNQTTGKPPNIAIAPQLTGLIGFPANMFTTVIPTPQMKQAQTEAVVTPRQYKPNIKGARKAPAKAPQDIPINWAIKVGGLSAISNEITIKKTIRTRITTTFRCSIFSATSSLISPSSTSPGIDFLSR